MEPAPHADEPWRQSQLFTVRIWCEQTGPDALEVRMQVRHVLTGEIRFFRAWPALAEYLTSHLSISRGGDSDMI